MKDNVERATGTLVSIAVIGLLLAQGAVAQTLTAGDPGANVNIVGPTPDPADIRDFGLKQQNEPSCAIRPGDSACIICGFNDYRTVDVPGIEDAWQGVAMSCDGGTTWTSRIAPGHPVHPAPIGTEFAADPRMIALPGIAVFNFIGGDRDQDSGVLAIQHWLEINKEDADYYEPGKFTYIADTGSAGRFIDKPDATFLPDKPQQQGTISLSTTMENEALGTIQRDVPTGKLFVAFAVFTGNPDSGNQSVKVLVKDSDDLGQTWQNQVVKLSEDQNLVSGISLSAMGDSVLAIWRRAGDNNDFDSIMYAYTNNRGKKWTKGEVLADICSFDQVSATSPTAVTFRTNDFPWAANDGENFYVFYSDRNYNGASDCSLGRPRIVVQHASSASGLGTSVPIAVDDSDDGDPTTTEDAAGGFQFMPAATAANGKLQVAWYDTRREGDLPNGFFLDANSNLVPVDGDSIPVIADYKTSTVNVSRKVDVYTARITSDGDGGIVKSAPERVSQFRIRAVLEGGELGSTAIEGEASFANAKLYASGSLSFIGDYIAVGAQQFRFDGNGKVVSNAAPIVSPTADIADFFIAWTSNRDVRGNIFPDELEAPTPYTPPQNIEAPEEPPATGDTSGMAEPDVDDATKDPLLADNSGRAIDLTGTTRTTEGIEDPFDPAPMTCVPQALVEDRTRDANIYGARIRDRLRLTAPTPTKPLTNLQRAFPVALSNVNDEAQTYLLRVTQQPADFPSLGRASFRQLPAVPPFDQNVPAPVIWEELTVPAKSAFARTLFLVSNVPGATTGVQVFEVGCDDADPDDNFGPYQGSCTPITSITLGGEGPSGPLQQPDYQSTACEIPDPNDPSQIIIDPDCTDNVLQAELHNPELINPELINPELINPELINPELINPELINPELINPELINPELINLGFANPELINPELINPELINPELINPELINPELINPELINSSFDDGAGNVTLDDGLTWTDYTYIVRNTGNVTTSYNADITLDGLTADDVDSQLIAWTLYITPTSRDCALKPQIERRVLAVVNNPDNALASEELEVAKISDPFAGEISAIAVPGQALFFTRRVFGTQQELDNIFVSGFTSSSQAANCSQEDLPEFEVDPITGEILVDPATGENIPYERDYFCQQALVDERERILLDTQPPTFNLADDTVIPEPAIEADRPGGACVAIAGVLVTASDNGEPITDITCTNGTGEPICTTAESESGESSIPFSLPGEEGAQVSCTAVDDAGNIGQVNLFIDVRDTGDPFFVPGTFPTTITVDAEPDGFATFDFQNGVGIQIADLDDIDIDVSFTCVADTLDKQGPNDPLPVGATTIDCTVSDTSGNSTTESFVVEVKDVTPPQLSNVPPSFIIDATDPNGVTVTFELPDAEDAGSSILTIVCEPASDTIFAIGVTTVTCTATDASGNSTSASFDVTVVDAVPPVVTVPIGTIEVERQSAAGAIVDFSGLVSATDNITALPTIDCVPASGTLFGPGLTNVTCTATDAQGNQSVGSFDVNVEDTMPPTLSVPTTVVDVERQNTAGATYDFSSLVSATDNIDPPPTVVCSPPSNSVFAPGTTLVECTATDGQGNETPASFTINVKDTTAPIINSAPSGIIEVEQENAAGATFSYVVTATDSADPDPVIACSLPSDSVFPAGMTTVTCTATDDEGNVDTASFTVNVTDTMAPMITSAPSGIIQVERENTVGASYPYVVTATDAADPSPGIVCTPPGFDFGPGDTLVTCVASDNAGNSVSTSFTVNVTDTTDPVITAPSGTLDVERESSAGATFSYVVTATDSADPAPVIACSLPSGSIFPAGMTTVTCTATDHEANIDTASFVVNVQDNIDPVISVPSGGIDVEIQSADGSVVDYSGLVTATDTADPSPSISCTPQSGSLFPPGVTIEAGAQTVSCTATDHEGNTDSASFLVRVGYADGFGINAKKLSVRGGSSNPLSWGWLDANGAILDTSFDQQILEFSVCASSMPMFTLAGDPGSSGFRIKVDNSWEYNWQSDDSEGNPLPNLPEFYCVRVTSSLTGQFLDSDNIRVR